MAQDTLILAIGRMERALARIEHVVPRLNPQPDGHDPQLAQRHVRLQAETRAAIAAIGRLLGEEQD